MKVSGNYVNTVGVGPLLFVNGFQQEREITVFTMVLGGMYTTVKITAVHTLGRKKTGILQTCARGLGNSVCDCPIVTPLIVHINTERWLVWLLS